jgi:hypothetical protein
MKSDNLKHLIDKNREAFDSFEPSADLWQNIESGIVTKPAAFKTLVNKGWIKYGLSSLIIGTAITYFVAGSEPDKTVPVQNTATFSMTEDFSETKRAESEKQNHVVTANIVVNTPAAEKVTSGGSDSTKSPAPVVSPETEDLVFAAKELMPPLEEQTSVPADHTSALPVATQRKKGVTTLIDTMFAGVKRIEVKSAICDVNIKPGTGDKVVVHGNIYLEAKGITMNVKNNYRIEFEKQDSVLKVNVTCHSIKKPVVIVGVLKSEAALNFEIPAGVDMIVDGSNGNICVEDVTARTFDFKTNFGNIKANKVKADIKLKTSSGDIKVQQITGTVITETQFGDQRFENIEGDVLIRSSSGDIIAKQIKGKVNAKSSFGDQTYEMLAGDLVSTCGSGDIKLEEIKGHLKLQSRFGDIKGEKVEVLGNSEIETSSGDISIDFINDVESLGFNLQTTSGDIKVKKESHELRSENRLLIDDKSITVKGTTKFGDQSYR